jgi:2-oxoglutarate dehydrogenase E2 component (dihydrolipoamide succinyltransferase)
MSLELKIEALTAAVTALTAQLQAGNVAAPAPVAPAPAPVVQAAPVAAAPVAAPAPAPVAAAPAMPAPPTFVAPAPAPAPTGAPFSDPKGLIDYVMGAYKALGPQKGAMIQGVLTGLGYQNINDVKPEHYAALHTGVESLKG